MDNCTLDCIDIISQYSQDAACNYVTDSCVQDTVQFVQTYYCYLNQSFMLLILLSIFSLFAIYYALTSLTDDYLAPCVEEFIVKFNMSEALAGITLLAFANGAPDIITAIVAGSSQSDTTALIPFGSLYGAALFGMAFILSMVIIYSPQNKLTLKKREALIPLGFYIGGTIYIICVSLFYGEMNIIIAVIFLSFYLIYILMIIYDERKKKKAQDSLLQKTILSEEDKQSENLKKEPQNVKKQIDEVYESINKQMAQNLSKVSEKPLGKILYWIRLFWKQVFSYTIPPAVKDAWSPLRSIISLIISPFVICMSYGFVESFENDLLSVPYAVWFSTPSALLLIHSIYCVIKRAKPGNTIGYSIYSFLIIICWITTACSTLINLMELLQILTNVNSVFLGLTVFAWANSIGDYLSITTFAKKNYASTAVAGIFSGQLMNFLLGFGISSVIKSLDGGYEFVIFDFKGSTFDKLSDAIVVSVIGLSLVYMIWISYRIIRTNGVLQLKEQKIAKYYYIGYVLTALIMCVIADFFRQAHCDT